MPFLKNAAILREGISILENADNIGVPIPQRLLKLFFAVKK